MYCLVLHLNFIHVTTHRLKCHSMHTCKVVKVHFPITFIKIGSLHGLSIADDFNY